MTTIEKVLRTVKKAKNGLTTQQVQQKLNISRSTASAALSTLEYQKDSVYKYGTRPNNRKVPVSVYHAFGN